jgi:DNA-binding NarL/FixJ family response regulator
MIISQYQQRFNLLIVDDHELTRFSLKLLFTTQKHINIVGLASNGLEAIDLVKLHSPDVIILDLEMPIMNGFTAAREIKKINSHTRIIAHSSHLGVGQQKMNSASFIDYFYSKEINNISFIALVNQLGEVNRQLQK